MTAVLIRLASFAGQHWLRILIVGAALVLLSDKQVNFNIRLGKGAPAEAPVPAALPGDALAPAPVANPERPVLSEREPAVPVAAKVEEKAGFLDRFNFFGSDEPSGYDLLTRQSEDDIAAFIRRFSNVAQAEQEKFGVPASVTLAAGLLYGRAGAAEAAKAHHAYFGLGCDADWPGATGRANGQCVRAYENAWTGFRDFSLYVTSGRFEAMKQFSETDYRKWSAGLEELGYGDTDGLAEQLVRTVDRYQLFRFD